MGYLMIIIGPLVLIIVIGVIIFYAGTKNRKVQQPTNDESGDGPGTSYVKPLDEGLQQPTTKKDDPPV